MDYKKLKDEFQAPFYIYDFDFIKERFSKLKNAFKTRKSRIFYAVKANSNLSLLQVLVKSDSGFDYTSIGEVKRALKTGAKPYKIIFSGVGKTQGELRPALEYDILCTNLGSEAETMFLESITRELDLKARVSIRVNPNVNAKTHPYISTGLNENKFGVEIDLAGKMYFYTKNSPRLEPIGVHFHVGSQLLDISPIHEAAAIVAKLVREPKVLQIEPKFFNIGGGFEVKYEKRDVKPDPYDYAQGMLVRLHRLDVTIEIEPGRFLVTNSGEFVCSMLYEKHNKTKRFVIVDEAMNDLIHPSLCEACHEVLLPYNQGEESPCDVVGGIYESEGFFAKTRSLPGTQSSDIMATKDIGAYGSNMSSNYSTRNKVCELALEEGQVRLIHQREDFEDQIALEEKFLKA